MAMKTNKSYKKRIKIAKSGKLVVRKPGQNHFNAKEGQANKSAKKKNSNIQISNKNRSRYLVNM